MKKFLIIGVLLMVAVAVTAGTSRTQITATKESATCWSYEVRTTSDKGRASFDSVCLPSKTAAKVDLVAYMTKLKQFDPSVKTSGVQIVLKDLTQSESLE